MRQILWNSIQSLAERAVSSFVRFPGVITSAVLATSAAVAMVESHGDDLHLVAALLLGLPLFLALTLFRESRGWRSSKALSLEFVGGAIFILGYYLLTKNDRTVDGILRYLQVSLILHLLVALSSSAGAATELGFWQLNRAIFQRILLSFLYAAVLFCGLAIALLTVEKLFELKLASERYTELWLVSAILFQTWHFVAGLPTNFAELNQDRTTPAGLKIFVQYLLIPLVSLYMLILYVYMAKILVTHEWPRGYLGWLVSVISVLGVLNLLLLDPEKREAASAWIRTYGKAFYLLILPLLGMLFVAVARRVAEYGVTEPRYVLFVLGLYLAGISLYFLFGGLRIRVIPSALAFLALLTLGGPWGPAAVSERSQRARAQTIMERNHMLDGGHVKPAPGNITNEDRRELREIFEYLAGHHGVEALEPWLPKEKRAANLRENGWALAEYLGITSAGEDSSSAGSVNFDLSVDPSTLAADVAGFEKMVELQGTLTARTVRWRGHELTVRCRQNFGVIVEEGPNELVRIGLREPFDQLRKAWVGKGVPADLFTFDGHGKGLRVQVIVRNASGNMKTDDFGLSSFNADVFIGPASAR